jgi:hypothetical protein
MDQEELRFKLSQSLDQALWQALLLEVPKDIRMAFRAAKQAVIVAQVSNAPDEVAQAAEAHYEDLAAQARNIIRNCLAHKWAMRADELRRLEAERDFWREEHEALLLLVT